MDARAQTNRHIEVDIVDSTLHLLRLGAVRPVLHHLKHEPEGFDSDQIIVDHLSLVPAVQLKKGRKCPLDLITKSHSFCFNKC